jgi:hypothetical protein
MGGDWLALKSDWLALKRLICNDEHKLAVANASREDAMLLDCLHILKTDCTGLARRWVRMKKLLNVLGILAIGGVVAAGCSYQSQIDQATSQAEGSAQQAATASTNAQNSANAAAGSAKNAQEAAAGAQDSVKRANDAVARLEAEFASSVTK